MAGAFAPHPARAQEPQAQAVDGLPGVALKLVPPAGLCRVDPVEDEEAFEAAAGLLGSEMLALWFTCADLARYRAGEDGRPARWMYVLVQRDGKGQVRPLPNITRQEAFDRWADAWENEAEARIAQARKKLRAELDLEAAEIGKPQIFGPDGTAIYLAMPGQLTDAGAAQPTRVASVSGWSMILNYRLGIGLAERDAGAERFPAMVDEVRAVMMSLDRLSVATPGR
ncbi:hypothetical protein GCM10007301_00780 [Azorhizobium oxalatiphilum]|uniref:Uncharacterized protein n=1 Tax=Azorhizobium oxalatiphilum TaxID=980631 RepID=A0A917F200_9HYPH|nr:hypothetical protein [Azorhizobium oxalatiphilum]GGF45125.1 hypothetical protein GCM10007301_00780 [Azorhizobium oxalatiphilum]